jgi:hypothetical protein
MATSDWIAGAAFVLSVISILWQFVRESNARHVSLLERKNAASQICRQAIRSLMEQRRELAAIANLELTGMPREFEPMLKSAFQRTVEALRDAKAIEKGLDDFDRERHTRHAKRVIVERMYGIASTMRDYAEELDAPYQELRHWRERSTRELATRAISTYSERFHKANYAKAVRINRGSGKQAVFGPRRQRSAPPSGSTLWTIAP